MKRTKRIVRITACLLLSPLVVLAMVAALLYVPPVQRWAVRQGVEFAREATGFDIQFDAIHIAFPLDISLHGLTVAQQANTLLVLERAVIELDFSHITSLNIGVESIELEHAQVDTHQLIEAAHINGYLKRFALSANRVDLRNQHVQLDEVTLQGGDIHITLNDSTTADTTESNPILWTIALREATIAQSSVAVQLASGDMVSVDSLGLGVRNVAISLAPLNIDGQVTHGHFCENHGVSLTQLATILHLDDACIRLHDLDVATTASRLQGDVNLDWTSLTPDNRGQMMLDVTASLGHQDVKCFADLLPEGLSRYYPEQDINMQLQAHGNVDTLNLARAVLTMPTVMDVRAEGCLLNVLDMKQLGADVALDARTMNLDWLCRWQQLNALRLPPMTLNAKAQLREGSRIKADALLAERDGRMHLNGALDTRSMAFRAKFNIANLQLHDFLPYDSLYQLTAHADVSGRGTNLLSKRTTLLAQLQLDTLIYGPWQLSNLQFTTRLQDGKGMVELNSDNELLGMNACADAVVDGCIEDAKFSMDLSRINLHALRLTPKPLSASMVMHLDGFTNLKETHQLNGNIRAIELVTQDSVYHPLDLQWAASADTQNISAWANAGDLDLRLKSNHSIDSLLAKSDVLVELIKAQLSRYHLAQDTLKRALPHVELSLQCGQRNPLSNILRAITGYNFKNLDVAMNSDTIQGLNGYGHITSFNTGGILLDTIRWQVSHCADGVLLDACVRNNKRNRVAVFTSNLQAKLTSTGAEAALDFIDANNRKGVDIGARTDVTPDGIRLHFAPLNPIIAYRRFTLNEDNFAELTRDGRVQALIDLLADDGTGLKIYSTPNDDAQQDLSLSVNRLNIGELAQALPYMPDVKGFLHGDVHYMQQDSTLTLSTDMGISDLIYNGTRIGHLGLNGIYFPNPDGSHFVDAILALDGEEISTLSGSYLEQNGEGYIDGAMEIDHLPLRIADAFVPEGLLALKGYAHGSLQLGGTTTTPVLNGALSTDSMHVVLPQYNVNLRIPNDTLLFDNSLLRINNLTAYAAGQSPMTFDGSIDFRHLSNVLVDMRLRAKNYQLINAPRSRGALAYGKIFVDIMAMARGRLDDLHIRGNLSVLGNTDVSYVLTDSPITVEDQMADLVTFCDFTDTTQVESVEKKRQNIDIQMNVSVAQAAQAHCILSNDGSDRIDLQGGGDLTLTYDMQNEMRMYGRYTILNGVMRYSLMAIPLNNFLIKSGSYVEFNGDMMNPTLNIQASERVKASVSDNNSPRNVAFNVGLALSRTLDDMGLQFTLEAPEDLTMQNELTAMSEEERSRVAVTMLITGMYISDNFNANNGFSYTNTLNAYLQSAVNKIAGQALSTVDLNFGIENSNSQTGSTTTDYSFSFAKRFWGNRISLVIGGKVSSGRDAVNNGLTIINNVSVEYRLDESATRNVRLYYDRNHESLIEGELTEMGAGLVLHRKSNKLGDLFIFKKTPSPTSPQGASRKTPPVESGDVRSREQTSNPK